MAFILKSNDNTSNRPSLVPPGGQTHQPMNGQGGQKVLLRLGNFGQSTLQSQSRIGKSEDQLSVSDPTPLIEASSIEDGEGERNNEIREPGSNRSATVWDDSEVTNSPVRNDNGGNLAVSEESLVEPTRPRFVFEQIHKVKQELIEIDDASPPPPRRRRSSLESLSVSSELPNTPSPLSMTRPLRRKPKPAQAHQTSVRQPVFRARSTFKPERKYDSKIGHYYSCPKCDQKYVSVECVQEHLSSICTETGKSKTSSSVRNSPSVANEYPVQAADEQYKFQCTYPGCTWTKRYRTAEELVRFHINSKHATIPAKKKKCPHCGVMMANLARHIRLVHPEECTQESQDKDFRPNAADERRHRIPNRTSTIETRWPRRRRPPGSQNKAQEKTGSTGGAGSVGTTKTCIMEYKCAVCPQAFSSMPELDQHSVEHRIEVDKPYKCAFCEKSFFLRSYLDEHLRSHVQEYPYTCKQCDQCFNKKSDYDDHLKKHADGTLQKNIVVEVIL